MNNMNYICKICNREFKTMRALSYHIHFSHNMSGKEYYDKFFKKENDGICAYCGKPTPFLGLADGYQKYCCAKCGGKGSSKQGKETMLRKYGQKGITNAEAIRNRNKNYSEAQKKAIISKGQQTRIKNYGSVATSYQEQAKKSIETKQQAIQQFEQENNCTMLYTLVYKYGQGWYKAGIITDLLQYKNMSFVKNADIPKIEKYLDENKYNQASHSEFKVVDYIKNIYNGPIEQHKRGILPNNLEIDIYLPEKHLGIEFNGTYWHSSLADTPKNYHFNKSVLASEAGIRLIHIYEYEWTDQGCQDKIKQMLSIALDACSTRIYARQCTIRQITNKEAAQLNNKVHLQGHRNAQVTYGLFYKNELVQLMSFSKTKYNKNLKDDNSWEIIRGCPGSNNIVIGGVSKLFKHFIQDYKPSSIFSYCDFNKFDGKSYEKLGMQFIGYTGPDMKWVLPGNIVVNRLPHKHAELKAQARGKIYGSGSKKYIYNAV